MQGLAVGCRSVGVDLSLEPRELLGLLSAAHEAHLVNFEKRLEQISTADIKESLDFVIAGVLPETFVVEICLIKLNRRALIAHHELLEA